MDDNHDMEASLWAYLNGELPEAEKSAFEKELETNAALRESLELLKNTQAALNDLAAVERNDEARINRLIDEFDEWHAPAREKQPRMILFPSWLKGFAAVAAMLVILATTLISPKDGIIEWSELEITLEASRGDAEEAALPDADTLKQWHKSFIEAVNHRYKEAKSRGAPDWQISTSLKRGPQESFIVNVVAVSSDEKVTSLEWYFEGKSVGDLTRQTPSWSSNISELLAKPPPPPSRADP